MPVRKLGATEIERERETMAQLYIVVLRSNLDDVLIGTRSALATAANLARKVAADPTGYCKRHVKWQAWESGTIQCDVFKTVGRNRFEVVHSEPCGSEPKLAKAASA